MTNIEQWLGELGLTQYARTFLDNGIDLETLALLKEPDLEKLGLALGHRRKLLSRIAELPLRESFSPAKAHVEDVPKERKAERRQITVVFCDLVGSVALSERLDPEDWVETLRAYQRSCAAQIVRYGGYVANYVGDGIVAYFGYPRAYENAPERAVRAALGIVYSVARIDLRADIRLEARAGLATGLAVVGDVIGRGTTEQTLAAGRIPNLAARIQAITAPGTVAVAESTRRLLGTRFKYRDLGPHELKGIQDAVRLWQVLGEQTGALRFGPVQSGDPESFVGRQHELERLRNCWRSAAAGESQVVYLSGEAGIGKSRLCAELMALLAAEPHYPIWLQCSEIYQDSTLYPVIIHIEQAAGFEHDDPAEVRLAKLEALLDVSGGRETAPLFAELLSIPSEGRYQPSTLSPAQHRARLLSGLCDRVLEQAHLQPVVVLLEDAQWMDPSTEEAIGQLINRMPGARVLLVVIHRPGFVPRWSLKVHLTELSLERLDRQSVEKIIAQVAARGTLPAATIAEIAARTDGVPLFIEEVTKSVKETSLAPRDAKNRASNSNLSMPEVPPTLHDSLMARLDRLSDAKPVAQLAATVGRTFSLAVLSSISPLPPPKLRQTLDKLVEAKVIYRSDVQGDIAFSFRHALLQDVAYHSLLKKTRQQYHAATAESLIARFPTVASVQPELIAYHMTEAGNVMAALRYWHEAGMRATRRSANVEALAHYKRALAIAETDQNIANRDDWLFQVYMGMVPPLIAIKGYAAAEVEQTIARALQFGEQVGEASQFFPVLYGRWANLHAQGQIRSAVGVGEEYVHLAERQSASAARPIGLRILGSSRFVLGEPVAARPLIEQSIAIYDVKEHGATAFTYGTDHLVCALGYLGLVLWTLGLPDQALACHRQAIDRARAVGHANSLGYALFHSGAFLHALCRNSARTESYARELLIIGNEHNLPLWSATGRVAQGQALIEQGRVKDGVAHLQEGLTALDAIKIGLFRPAFLAWLAAAQGQSGNPDAGLATIQKAWEVGEYGGERWMDAELHRVKGDLLTETGGATDLAESCHLQAMNLAQHQGAKMLELRAAVSLAKLSLRHQTKSDVSALLDAAYKGVIEGDTLPDMSEALALRNAIASASPSTSRR